MNPSREVRIVLTMIVKDEAAVIGRCLAAALPHVDGYVICDTGSRDATVDEIARAGAAAGVAGVVRRHEWRNFGHNRTLAAAEAQAWARERGWDPARSYLLFLDADMVLHVEPAFDRAALAADGYLLAQEDSSLRYYNTRLGRLDRQWRSVGVTHEYWQADGAAAPERIDSVWIADIGDGGSKQQKFERDIALLTEGLKAEPDNVRYMFYLAQSLHDVGRWSEAYAWYQRRRDAGGWAEERWYAHFRQGLCLLQMAEPERAAGVLLNAFEERPTRAEPLHALCRHYRLQGKSQLAMTLALRALQIGFPAEDTLFVAKSVYDWELWEEVMISAYYVGRHDLGLAACERLLGRRGHAPAFYDYVARNQSFYLRPLEAEGARRGMIQVPEELLAGKDGFAYAGTNPTLIRRDGATDINVRLVNYRQERGLGHAAPGDGIIRTRNVTLHLESHGDRLPRWARQSHPASDAAWSAHQRVQGLEDMRWAEHDGRVWFTATSHTVPGREGQPQVVLGRMNEALDGVEYVTGLSYEHGQDCEKNWVLWPRGDVLYALYSYDPTVVLRLDPGSGEATPVARSLPPWPAGRFRGSTSPVPVPGSGGGAEGRRWVALVHEVAFDANERVYTHRWIELDDRFRLVGRSRAFVFDHRGVEYAAGLIAVDDERLVVTYGFEDREARWLEVPWRAVLREIEMLA